MNTKDQELDFCWFEVNLIYGKISLNDSYNDIPKIIIKKNTPSKSNTRSQFFYAFN